MGRMFGMMEFIEIMISMKGFELFLLFVDNIYNDLFEFYYGLFMYNKNVIVEFFRFEFVFIKVKGELFDCLYECIWNDIFEESWEDLYII